MKENSKYIDPPPGPGRKLPKTYDFLTKLTVRTLPREEAGQERDNKPVHAPLGRRSFILEEVIIMEG